MLDSSSRVRIVALGDSLTSGFQSGGPDEEMWDSTPYTDFLIDRIVRDFPFDSSSIEIINKGIVGELTEHMVARFESDVIRISPRMVIILGGSNDLGWGLSSKSILQNLMVMYRLSRENGIVPIACTVPSILGYDEGIAPRILLNGLLRQHCRDIGMRCVDLFRATADADTSRLALEYSSDGLHLNSNGYRKMAAAIYEEGLGPVLHAILERRVPSGDS